MRTKSLEEFIRSKTTYNKSFELIKDKAVENYCPQEKKKINIAFLSKIGMGFVTLAVLVVALFIIIDDNRYVQDSIYVSNKDTHLNYYDNRIFITEGEVISLVIHGEDKLSNIRWYVNDQNYIRITEGRELIALKATSKELYITIEGVDKKGKTVEKIIHVYVNERITK